jgi:hypothetical protein
VGAARQGTDGAATTADGLASGGRSNLAAPASAGEGERGVRKRSSSGEGQTKGAWRLLL